MPHGRHRFRLVLEFEGPRSPTDAERDLPTGIPPLHFCAQIAHRLLVLDPEALHGVGVFPLTELNVAKAFPETRLVLAEITEL